MQQPILDSKWLVRIGQEEFVLTAPEAELLKKASIAGKTLIWFKDKAISIPHISFMQRIDEPVFKTPELPEMTEDQVKRNRERIAKMKKEMRLA